MVETLSSFTGTDAEVAYTNVVDALGACPTVRLTRGNRTVVGTVAASSSINLPVQSNADRVSVSGSGASPNVGIVVFRRGHIMGTMMYYSPSGDPTILTDYAQRAVGKLRSIG